MEKELNHIEYSLSNGEGTLLTCGVVAVSEISDIPEEVIEEFQRHLENGATLIIKFVPEWTMTGK